MVTGLGNIKKGRIEGEMITKQVIVELLDGTEKTFTSEWTKKDNENFRAAFGEDIEEEIVKILFENIMKSLKADKISLTSIKSIRFDSYKDEE
jgi:hypothetical protein